MNRASAQSPDNTTINQEVGANQRLARLSEPVTPEVQKLIDHVLEHGYAILENVFTGSEVDEALAELDRLSKSQEEAGPSATGGRNSFEGFKTRRIYALLNKSRIFDKFVVHPSVLALNDYFLDQGYLINAYHSISIQPGEKSQTLHHDDGTVTVPRPHRPFGTAIMVALDPYTETNGATVIVLKSHRWGTEPIPGPAEAVPVIMPKGSVVYFLGTLWHGGGQNQSGKERRALTVQYCQPWMRPLENQILAVDWRKLGHIPPRIVDMLGYKVGAPFIGYVDGVSPRRAVAEAIQQQDEEKRKNVAKL